MKTTLCLACAAILIASYTYGQTTSASDRSTTTDSANTTTRSITDNAGMVVDQTPTTITIDDGNSAAPVRFQLADKVRVVGPDSSEDLTMAAVKKQANVKLHFTQEDGRQVVDQITLQKR
jgi:hypothetical protein